MPVVVTFLNPNVLNLLAADLRRLGKDFSRRGGLREPIEKSVREVLIPSITENFLAGGRPAWEDLAPATLATRSGRGVPGATASSSAISAFNALSGSMAPLMRTRKMFNAAKAMARWIIKENEAKYDLGSFPSHSWYAIVHDQDSIAESAGIPVRPFAVIQPEDIEDITKIFADWVEKKIRAGTRRVYT